MIWKNTYEEIKLLEPTDQTLKYQKIVALQNSFEVLKKVK